MAKIVGYTYKVRGRGAFPVDMLRYDCAWPNDSRDLINITIHHGEEDYNEQRVVSLRSHREPTAARWTSFGWTVTNVETIRR